MKHDFDEISLTFKIKITGSSWQEIRDCFDN